MSAETIPPKAAGELLVITAAYDLLRELTERVNKYPRSHKFVLGERTLHTMHGVFDRLLEAKYRREKAALLDAANLGLERLRFQLRLGHDLKVLTPTAYGVLARQVNETGRLVGGWRRSRGPASAEEAPQ